MKTSFIIFLLIVFVLFLISNFYIIEEVKTVVDGDMIKLKDGKVVRLLGINALQKFLVRVKNILMFF